MRSSVISLEGMVTLKLHALQWRRFLGRNQILFGFGRSFWDMFVDMEIDNSEIRFTPERCRISKRGPKPSHPSLTRIRWSYCILQEKHKKTLDPSICNQTHPSTWCTLHKFHAQTKIAPPSKAHLGNDFGLWSAQLALPWWCPDPCCGMWRSLSATVDPQRSEIQDGRVVPWALWLGSSVVCVILVTYGFLMAFTI